MTRIRVGRVAHPIADHVESQYRDDHEKPRQQQPRRHGHSLKVLRLLQQHPPANHGCPQPNPQKTQRGLAENHARHG